MASAAMLAPPQGSGRISQLLPSVKCSSCNQPVPLAELGEHVCAPLPPVPSLPKPSMSQQNMVSLLPDRLKGRVVSPGPSPTAPNSIPPAPRDQHQRIASAASDRLRINPNFNGPPTRSSPLASSPRSPGGDLQPPVRMDMRMRTTSLSSTNSGPQMTAGRERSPTYNGPQPPLPDPRYPPSRTGTPSQPNGAPLGLPSSPRVSPTSPRLPFNVSQRGGPSPAPSSGTASPAPSMGRNNGLPPPPGGIPPRPPPSGGPQGMRPGMPPGPPFPGGPPGMRPGMPPQGVGLPSGPRAGMVPPQGPPGPRPPTSQVRFAQGPGGPPGPLAPPPPISATPARTSSPFILPPGAPGGPSRTYTPQLPPASLGNLPPGQVISESDIDTKTGGEAGMAGVGRRGFAAVARAAMFAAPPKSLRGASRADDTSFLSSNPPPQSPNSPLVQSRFPQSRPPDPPQDTMAKSPNLPSKIDTSLNSLSSSNERTPVGDKDKTPLAAAPATPASPFGIRLPFFEKLKNMVPGSTSPSEPTPTAPEPPAPTALTRDNTKSSHTSTPSDSSGLTNLRSVNSTSSSKLYRPSFDKGGGLPSPTEESEYSGLAYARSDEEEDSRRSMRSTISRKRSSPPPPLPPKTAAVARTTSNGRVAFSTSPEAIEGGEPRRNGVPIPTSGRPGHSRNNSESSSYSSASSVGQRRERKNSSAAIAQALGLSRTPSREYAKIGGPGRPLVRSASSSSSRSAYSRTGSVIPVNGTSALDALERSLVKNHEKKGADLSKSKPSGSAVGGRGTRAGNGTSVSGSVRGTEYTTSEGDSTYLPYGKAQRSKTVTSPEVKPVKLPARAKTTVGEDRSTVNGDAVKAKKRKEKVCVKCTRKIDDGRWIQVDTGSILCEKCWKNMYLPKCRRCNLPIEKQAVSSSDGQLKGKYHKECFNCHTCQKPFPDKTFYVYEGKPFCAYHYHEANDSLCAAAKCGQPIEGPCAVSHAGDRYHLHCITCEYPGYPACRERLEEYWEVDGRMLCEHHATMTNADDYDSQWAANAKAMKRVTRFIDLTGGAGGNNNPADDEDSGLR